MSLLTFPTQQKLTSVVCTMTSSSLAHVNRRLKRRYYRLGRHRKKPPDPGGGSHSPPNHQPSHRHHSRSHRHSYRPTYHHFPCHNASPSDYSSYILQRLPQFGLKSKQHFRHCPRIAPIFATHKESRAAHRRLHYTSLATTRPDTSTNPSLPTTPPQYPYHATICQAYDLDPSHTTPPPPPTHQNDTIDTNTSPPIITKHTSPLATLPLLLYFWIFMAQITSKSPPFSSKTYDNYPRSSPMDACHLLPQPNFTLPSHLHQNWPLPTTRWQLHSNVQGQSNSHSTPSTITNNTTAEHPLSPKTYATATATTIATTTDAIPPMPPPPPQFNDTTMPPPLPRPTAPLPSPMPRTPPQLHAETISTPSPELANRINLHSSNF